MIRIATGLRLVCVAFALHQLIIVCSGCNSKKHPSNPVPVTSEPTSPPPKSNYGTLDLIKAIDVPTGSVARGFAVAPDGKSAAIGGGDGSIVQVDLAGMSIKTFDGHREAVLELAFTPDGRRLISGGADNQLVVWDVKTGTVLNRKNKAHNGDIKALAISPDGALVASGSVDDTIRVWRIDTLELLHQFEGHTMSVYAAVFAPNGRHVFSGARDAEIRKWSLETGRQVSEPLRFRNSITSLHYGPDHRTLVAASLSNEIFIIDADEFRILGKKRLSGSSRLADIDVSSDGVIAAVQRGGDLTLWSSDLQVSEAISESRASALEFDMVSFVPRTERVIALASNGTMSTADTTTGQFIGKPISLPPVNGSVRAAALSEQTKSYAVASEGRLFSGSFDKDLREIPMEGSQVSAVTFVPRSTELLVGHFDGRLQRISSVSGDILEDTKPHNGAIRHLQYSAYDETLWSAGDDITILRHGLDSNSATLQFTDHTSPIRALAIDPTGQRFASTETNNITIIRHIANNETQWTRRGHAIDFLSF
ncbi:MAG: WD40 repeat domain-containing protein, partial [Myxococcota bacterium]|nr:WD40 repeat domain-containing protein [Myxococcota bacterium]